MRRLFLILGLILSISTNARAELYHGIDIDAVYESSDWSSKEKIKEIIDDYTLLLQYQKELDDCQIELPEVLECYDKVAEKIITNLYVSPKINIEQYEQLKKSLSNAYGLKNCRNKYAWPSGNICEINSDSELAEALRKYNQDLIYFTKKQMFIYSPILEKYK